MSDPSRGGRRADGRVDNGIDGGTPNDSDAPSREPTDEAGLNSGQPRISSPPMERGVDAAHDEKAEAVATGAAGGEMRQQSLWGDAWRTLRRKPGFLFGATVLIVLTVMSIWPSLFTSVDPGVTDLSRSLEEPSADAWFGFDVQGADFYSNVIYGARVSMIIGLAVVLGALLIAVTLGALAGFYGGLTDSVIARLTDVVYGLPFILGAILILQVLPGIFQRLGLQDDSGRSLIHVVAALVVLSWMTPMRLVRSTVLSVKGADYVQAAHGLGASNRRIILRHILPNAIAPVLVYGTILAGTVIAAEAALSFLGVGLQLPAISWGVQLNLAQNYLRTAPHLLLFPGVFLSVTVLSFILVGDALRDALDPKLR